MVSSKEANDLAVRAKGGDRAAQSKLAAVMEPLVISIAQKVTVLGMEPGDKISICYLNLIKAWQRFEPVRGANFVTYAHLLMFRALLDCQKRDKWENRKMPKSELKVDMIDTAQRKHSMIEMIDTGIAIGQLAAEAAIKQIRSKIASGEPVPTSFRWFLGGDQVSEKAIRRFGHVQCDAVFLMTRGYTHQEVSAFLVIDQRLLKLILSDAKPIVMSF